MPLRSFQNCTPRLGQRVMIDPSAVVIGDVHLGDDCSVWPMAVIRGDMHSIRIGKGCSIQDGSVLHITHAGPFTGAGQPLIIGDYVTIGHQALLHGCRIGNQVLIGMNATVMDGAILEDQLILAAGSLVPPNKRLASGFVYKGNTAQAVRALTEQEYAFLQYTAQNYVNLKDQYLAEAHQENSSP
ncbi:anhydrase [Thiopseudomonas alkaliphila]|uniref:gamma carbonic anhydrase family protein n=1 Tax=Thiopseudomonas alkaliphila TaxID=1697053 RepID=UPI00069F5192|nr:gamma carbonic anhydrase family protein [Thiopseudomonas alkaliphila]AKX45189.1 anhydrase [Thiopseudomonas alkaliphila]